MNISRKNINGYTLLELLITIAVISVMTTIGFQSVASSINSQKTSNAAKQVEFALKKARYYAKTKGQITHVSMPVGTNKYVIEANDIDLTSSDNIDGTSGVLPENIKFQTNTCGDIYFYVDGTPLTSAEEPISPLTYLCSITVSASAETDDRAGNKSETLTLMPYSGSIVYE